MKRWGLEYSFPELLFVCQRKTVGFPPDKGKKGKITVHYIQNIGLKNLVLFKSY